MTQNNLVITLNSEKHQNKVIYVGIEEKRLAIEQMEALNDRGLWYVVDLIDRGEVIAFLKQHKIEYLHLVHTELYRVIDQWDREQA